MFLLWGKTGHLAVGAGGKGIHCFSSAGVEPSPTPCSAPAGWVCPAMCFLLPLMLSCLLILKDKGWGLLAVDGKEFLEPGAVGIQSDGGCAQHSRRVRVARWDLPTLSPSTYKSFPAAGWVPEWRCSPFTLGSFAGPWSLGALGSQCGSSCSMALAAHSPGPGIPLPAEALALGPALLDLINVGSREIWEHL